MASCAAQTFTGISPAQFQCLVQEANTNGIQISGNSGSASKDGITITWAFDPDAETLVLQCTSSPFFLSCGTINSKIHDLVDQCSS